LVPTSAFSVVVFFLFVVPGTYYELRRNRTLFPSEESTFLQISRILLSGVALTAVAGVLLSLIYQISPGSLLNVPGLLRSGVNYVADHPGLVGKTLIAQLAVSALLAAIAGDLLTRSTESPIHRGTSLYGATQVDKKPTETAYVGVKLKSGIEVLGYYYGLTTDYDPDKQVLALQPPLLVVHKGSSELVQLDQSWKQLVVAGSQIEYVTVKYSETDLSEDTEESPKSELVTKATVWYATVAGLWRRRWPRIGIQFGILCLALVLSAL
jgi:hypothetical protein